LWLVGSEVSSFNPATREEFGVVGMMVGLRGRELKEVGVHTSVKLAKLERLHDARFIRLLDAFQLASCIAQGLLDAYN
jgi:hypothetical protein